MKKNKVTISFKQFVNENKIDTENNVEQLQEFFESEGLLVHLYEQDGEQYAELETWTNGGVNMIINLQPFTIESFENYVNDFDIDEEIDLHRQGKSYKQAFTIRESVEDFEDYVETLNAILDKLKKLK